MNEVDKLTERIIGCALEVHKHLGPGYLESVYEKALSIELDANGLPHTNQIQIPVLYRGQSIGDFVADIFVDGQVIIELKACQTLHARHEAQLVNYLTATGIDNGLLFNFGTHSLQFKRKHRLYHPPTQSC
jgi:GxxExxY protein